MDEIKRKSLLLESENRPRAAQQGLATHLPEEENTREDLFKTIDPKQIKEESPKFKKSLFSSVKSDFKNSSDKPFVANAFSWLEAIHSIDKYASYGALFFNLFGAFVQLLGVSDEIKTKLSRMVDIITNLSFIPYGLDGIRIGAKEKKNPYQAIGFGMELITVWLSDLKMKYLVRGAGTGIDQIWVATDKKLEEEHGIKEGRFSTWTDGFTKVPQICLKMLQEIVKDPIKTIFTLKSKGHNALISSIGDIVSTLGFAFTGKENFFGPIRDAAAAMFDFELLLSSKLLQKLSGVLFILESTFDFIARVMPSNSLRLFMNHLSIGSGRAALMCYKNSDPNANNRPRIKRLSDLAIKLF